MPIDLFSPVRLGPYDLPNRIVMAPMTRQRAELDAIPSDLLATYYAQRASAGLIVTECTKVSEDANGYIGAAGLVTAGHAAGWKRVTDAVHADAGHIFIQLWHAGRVSHSTLRGGELPVAPSAILAPGQTRIATGRSDLETPRALELHEIPKIIDDFGRSARLAIDAGADGVELHGAFGYLVDSFLQESSNQRTDRYGGSIANRARFALEVTEAIVAAVGAERFGIKLSPSTRVYGMFDSNPLELFRYFIRALDKLGVAYIHMMEPSPQDLATDTVIIKETSKAFRPDFSGKIISNVGFTKESGNKILLEGSADLVSFAKSFISNPDLPARFKRDAPLTPVDFSTLFTPGAKGYIDYPPMH